MSTLKSSWPRILILVGGLLFVGSSIAFVASFVGGPEEPLAALPASSTPIIVPTANPAPSSTPRPDADSDGLPDASDLCPELDDPIQNDLDGDGWGDVCDIDIDGDGQTNINDACPFDDGAVCHDSPPDIVSLLNSAILQDQNTARVSYVDLAIFENPDPIHPALLNGVLYSSGDTPLWNAAGDLTLNLDFNVQSLPPLWPAAVGELGLSSGGLSLTCLAGDGGLCSGHLNLDLFYDNEPVTTAPACAQEDERCAWSVNAALGGTDATIVWGAFDAERNEIRFSTGMPAFPEFLDTTDYSLEVKFGDESTMRLGDPLPEVKLPIFFDDGMYNCTDLDQQPIECTAIGDIQTVNLNLEVVDGDPFLIVTIETAADLPLDRSADYVRFEAISYLEEAGQYFEDYHEFFPSDGGGSWSIQRWLEDSAGNYNRAAVSDGLTFVSDGNVATLHMPLTVDPPRSSSFFAVGAISENGGPDLGYDSVHDDLTNSLDLLFFLPGVEDSDGILPLVLIPKFASWDLPVAIYGLLRFPSETPKASRRVEPSASKGMNPSSLRTVAFFMVKGAGFWRSRMTESGIRLPKKRKGTAARASQSAPEEIHGGNHWIRRIRKRVQELKNSQQIRLRPRRLRAWFMNSYFAYWMISRSNRK